MFQPTEKLQSRIGDSLLVATTAIAISLLTGAVIDFSIAGANLSVNRKLQQVEKVKEKVENTVVELKNEPSVSRLKIQGLEAELEQAEVIVDDTEKAIEDDLDRKL